MGAAFKAFPHSNTDMKVNRRQNTLLSTKTLDWSKFVMNLWDTQWDNLFILKWIFVCTNVSSSLWKTWKIFWSARWLMFPVNASQFQNEPPRNGTNDDFQEIWKDTLFLYSYQIQNLGIIYFSFRMNLRRMGAMQWWFLGNLIECCRIIYGKGNFGFRFVLTWHFAPPPLFFSFGPFS